MGHYARDLDLMDAQIASESLSRVTCSFCGGRLYTHHKPGCPVSAAQERRNAELLKTMTEALRG